MHVTSAGDATRVDVLAAERRDAPTTSTSKRPAGARPSSRTSCAERDTAVAEADIAGMQASELDKAHARINLAG